jgi:hypothetical protein
MQPVNRGMGGQNLKKIKNSDVIKILKYLKSKNFMTFGSLKLILNNFSETPELPGISNRIDSNRIQSSRTRRNHSNASNTSCKSIQMQ